MNQNIKQCGYAKIVEITGKRNLEIRSVYVYRGTESADSQSVKANLEQIQKDLNALE